MRQNTTDVTEHLSNNFFIGEMVFVELRSALCNQDDIIALKIAVGVGKLKSAIIGLAQINDRDEISIEANAAFKKEYLQKKSLLFDLQLFIKKYLLMSILVKD